MSYMQQKDSTSNTSQQYISGTKITQVFSMAKGKQNSGHKLTTYWYWLYQIVVCLNVSKRPDFIALLVLD